MNALSNGIKHYLKIIVMSRPKHKTRGWGD
jgi:hypothetical protein